MRFIIVFMVLLFASNVKPAQAANDCPAINIPAYFLDSSTEDWGAIVNNQFARSRTDVVIVTPCFEFADGVCVKSSDPIMPSYTKIIDDFTKNGIRPIGYVWTNYGKRPLDAVLNEITQYRKRYKVGGFFLDGVPNGMKARLRFGFYKRVSDYIKNGPGEYVMLNPGVFPTEESYFSISDRIITFEQTYSAYVSARPAAPSYAFRIPSSKIANLVHTMPITASAVENALNVASARNVGAVYFTDLPGSLSTDNPWLRISQTWGMMLQSLASRCFGR